MYSQCLSTSFRKVDNINLKSIDINFFSAPKANYFKKGRKKRLDKLLLQMTSTGILGMGQQ